MDIKVNLQAEDINKAIADAIVQSILGEQIIRMVNEYLKTVSVSGYNNPIKTLIEAEGKNMIVQLLHEKQQMFKEMIDKELTTELAQQLVSKAIEKLVKGY
jgi:hypothetical protein